MEKKMYKKPMKGMGKKSSMPGKKSMMLPKPNTNFATFNLEDNQQSGMVKSINPNCANTP